jgi:hypothetical protein
MPFEVKVTVDGEQQTLAKFSNLNHAISTWQSALNPIQTYLMNFFQNDVYESEGAAYGSVWAALAPSTLRQKLKRWGNTTILIASGKMKNSYQAQSGPLYLAIYNTAQSNKGAPYPYFHQHGTRKMPQRLLMKMDDERTKQVKLMIVEALNVKINSI